MSNSTSDSRVQANLPLFSAPPNFCFSEKNFWGETILIEATSGKFNCGTWERRKARTLAFCLLLLYNLEQKLTRNIILKIKRTCSLAFTVMTIKARTLASFQMTVPTPPCPLDTRLSFQPHHHTCMQNVATARAFQPSHPTPVYSILIWILFLFVSDA